MEGITDHLPNDVLLHIFSYLDAISLTRVRHVCHRWNHLSTDEILWKHKILQDITNWKQISHISVTGSDVTDATESHCEKYLRSCPDIIKLKRALNQQNSLHQLTMFLKSMLPKRRYAVGVAGLQVNSMLGKILKFDVANPFQLCGQFPGKHRGAGAGMMLKYTASTACTVELSPLHIASRSERLRLSLSELTACFIEKMSGETNTALLGMFGGFIHTMDAVAKEGQSADSKLSETELHYKEVDLLNSTLKEGVPLLVLCMSERETDLRIKPYDVTQTLDMKRFKRPWLVAECCSEMLYRDIVEPTNWLLSHASSL